MRFSWARMALATVLAVAVVAPLRSASAQLPQDVRVDVNLKDADMLTATRMLTQRTGIQFVVEPNSEGFGKITLKIDRVTAEDAIRYICLAAGATFRRDENGVYIISRTKAVTTPEPAAPAANVPKIVRRIKILKAGAREVYESLLYGTAFNSERGFEELKRFTALALPNNDSALRPIYNLVGNGGSTQTYAPRATGGPISTPISGGESGNNVVLPDEGAGQLGGLGGGGLGGGGLGGGQGGLGGGQGGLGGGRGGQGGQGGNVTLQGGTGLVPSGIDYISYDPTDNSLVVRGTEEDINQLQTYINLFDVAPRQVLIKVEFITTTDTLDRTLGYEFNYARGPVFAGERPGVFAPTSAPIFFSWATGNVTMRLRAALSEGNGKVVSAPIVRTLNNQPATVANQIVTYIFVPQITATGAVFNQTYTPVAIPIATTLTVAPRINDDNTITMYLTPVISNIVGFSTSPDGQQIPNQATQAVALVARVRNNETIVLGGLNSKSEQSSTNRVPVLSELPIFGQFFRTNSRTRNNSELLIFVTPTILDEDTTGNPGGP